MCKARLYSCRQQSFQVYDLHELQHDTELTHLKVDGCSGIQSLPQEMNALVHLEGLHLTFLNLTSFDVKIRQMKGLLYLDLNSNPLGQIPSVLYDLPPLLFTLVLSNTSLSSLPEEALENWKDQLIVLSLDYNPQLTTFPMALLQFQRLASLDLSRTGMTYLPANFTLLQSLVEFEMSSCQLKTLPALDQLPLLGLLNLANNSLDHPPLLPRPPETFLMLEWSLNPFCALEMHRDTIACTPPTCSPDCSRQSWAKHYCPLGCASCLHPHCL